MPAGPCRRRKIGLGSADGSGNRPTGPIGFRHRGDWLRGYQVVPTRATLHELGSFVAHRIGEDVRAAEEVGDPQAVVYAQLAARPARRSSSATSTSGRGPGPRWATSCAARPGSTATTPTTATGGAEPASPNRLNPTGFTDIPILGDGDARPPADTVELVARHTSPRCGRLGARSPRPPTRAGADTAHCSVIASRDRSDQLDAVSLRDLQDVLHGRRTVERPARPPRVRTPPSARPGRARRTRRRPRGLVADGVRRVARRAAPTSPAPAVTRRTPAPSACRRRR